MKVLGIDPGTEKSAYVLFDGERVLGWKHVWNVDILLMNFEDVGLTAIERIRCYGPAVFVGNEILQTCEFAGRFYQEAHSQGCPVVWVPRKEAVIWLTGNPKSKDPQVRGCILDRFGGEKAALGNKKNPGPLYKVASHGWAALAVALTAYDLHGGAK